ncbi:DAK2 domain-containing protein [Candidatus Bipolaricaulota bacterium]|nr:DAK2 domain-containing protein [Candidatus Bipolaricaulota bacterium]
MRNTRNTAQAPVNLDGERIRKIAFTASHYLEENEELINALNVFPVPDGDTGSNMSMTLRAAVNGLTEVAELSLQQILRLISNNALLGARGNSGVILSQFLAGFADSIDHQPETDGELLARALAQGVNEAYQAVSDPQEGTILTVMRAAAKRARELQNKSLEVISEEMFNSASEALAQTPEMLPALKEAEVVDAGGLGFVYILQATADVLSGKRALPRKTQELLDEGLERMREHAKGEIKLKGIEEVPRRRYCLEFTLRGRSLPLNELKERVAGEAESVLVVGGAEVGHLHLHTDEPGAILRKVAQYGEISQVKIDDMHKQHQDFLGGKKTEVKVKVAVIAQASGDGLTGIMKNIGASEVLGGNPSVGEILEAIGRTRTPSVILLPNDKNILLACERAVELSEKEVKVVPSHSISQGISALLAFDPEENALKNMERMGDSLRQVKTGVITEAVRPTPASGMGIAQGDIIGILDGNIVVKGQELQETALALIERMITGGEGLLTLFYGEEPTEEEASLLKERIEQCHPRIEVQIYYGGQPHYHYIVSVE